MSYATLFDCPYVNSNPLPDTIWIDGFANTMSATVLFRDGVALSPDLPEA